MLSDPLQGGPALQVLECASSPFAQLLACLPRTLVSGLAAARCRDGQLKLAKQLCSNRAHAKAVVETLRLPAFCRAVSHLTSLDISDNNLGEQLAVDVMPLLAGPSQLRVLNISRNAMGAKGLDELTQYLDIFSSLQVRP